MSGEKNNGTGNNSLPDRPNQPETLLTDEAEQLIKHVREMPIETDEDLSDLGKIYTD